MNQTLFQAPQATDFASGRKSVIIYKPRTPKQDTLLGAAEDVQRVNAI